MSGSIVGALLSLGYLRLKFSRSTVKPTHKSKYSFSTFKKYSKTILKISIPIAIGAITMAIINFVDSFTVPYGLRSAGEDADNINYLYGIYGRGLALVQIATVFATSIVLPLIPLITKKLAEKDLGATKEILTRTYFLTHLISWPAAFGLLALTLPLNLALFTNLEGSLVLAIIGFSSVFTSFTILGTGILQGMNKAKVAAYIILIGVLLKTILNILFIKFFGLEGAALSTLIIYVIIVVLNTIFIFKAQRFTFVNNKIGAIFLSSIIMGAIVGLPTLYFDITSWTRFTALIYVAAAIIIGAMVYFIQLYLFKVVDRSMLGSLPLIGKYVQKTSSGHSIKRKEEQPLSKKRILIWIATIVLLIVSIPGVMNRWNAEESNNAYEIIVPYDEILELTEDGSLTLEQALNQLKEAGLNSVSFNPLSLATLEERGIITIYDQDELKDALRFSTLKVDFNEDEEGFYITVPDQEVYVKKIKENFNVDEVMIGNEQFYFLSNGDGIGIESIIGYDEEIINLIKEYEMDFVLRMENADFTSNMKAISDVIRLKDENTGSILFKGTEVVGYPKIEQMKAWGEELQNAGYSYHSIEFTNQKGLLGLARDSDYNIVRLHSINIDAEKLDDNVEKVIRATKERNVRSIFAHVPAGDPKESLKATSEFISTVHDRMPAHFEQGLPEPIEEIEVASWVLIAVLLAGVLFTYLGSEVVPNQKLRLLAAGFMLLLAVAAFLTKDIRLLQVYGLIIAIGTSIFAVLSVREGAKSIPGILIQFAKALGISIIGIYIMVSVLNGN
ncbi:DUF5693 family protein, partial [Gracilibacillus dipsosauri]|uniref:DUF5693 family protein n=1 Tax=Gracilibacillus dipsosauri TaxID=178340 RepID=UPI00240A57C7